MRIFMAHLEIWLAGMVQMRVKSIQPTRVFLIQRRQTEQLQEAFEGEPPLFLLDGQWLGLMSFRMSLSR